MLDSPVFCPVYRVHTHFSRSNSSVYLSVTFKMFQYLITGVKYISTGNLYTLMIIFFSTFFLSQ